MKLVIQYVSSAQVVVDNNVVGKINSGYCVLVGFRVGDSKKNLDDLAQKLLSLRTIPDKNDKINLSIVDTQGEILLVPQFTLYADTNKGHRPSFAHAAPPDIAKTLFSQFIGIVKQSKLKVESGTFGAHMHLTLSNNGPITITLED